MKYIVDFTVVTFCCMCCWCQCWFHCFILNKNCQDDISALFHCPKKLHPILIHNRSDLRRLRFIDAPPGSPQLKHRGDIFCLSPIHHRSGQMRIDPTLFSFPTWDGIGVCTRNTVIWQCMRCWGILIMFTMVRKGFSTLASQKEFSNLTFISIWDLANPPVTWPMD